MDFLFCLAIHFASNFAFQSLLMNLIVIPGIHSESIVILYEKKIEGKKRMILGNHTKIKETSTRDILFLRAMKHVTFNSNESTLLDWSKYRTRPSSGSLSIVRPAIFTTTLLALVLLAWEQQWREGKVVQIWIKLEEYVTFFAAGFWATPSNLVITVFFFNILAHSHWYLSLLPTVTLSNCLNLMKTYELDRNLKNSINY